MNYLSTVSKLDLDIEAILDEEEFSVPRVEMSDWRPLARSWLDKIEINDVVRSVDFTKVWEAAVDIQIMQAVSKAEVSFRQREASTVQDLLSVLQEQPIKTEAAQLDLAIAGSFTPSAELVEVWRDNASHYGDREAIARAKVSEASAEFSRMFRRLLGAFAQEKRQAGKSAVIIANAQGEFESYFQLDVSERFLLLPQKSASFFALLYRDLLKCDGEIYSAAWGAFLRRSDHCLVLQLNPSVRVRRDGFVKARETRK